jgi:hypothetical protein
MTNGTTPSSPKDVIENILPVDQSNFTGEELTWPIVDPKKQGRSIFVEGPPDCGNATDEELTWPVVPGDKWILYRYPRWTQSLNTSNWILFAEIPQAAYPAHS